MKNMKMLLLLLFSLNANATLSGPASTSGGFSIGGSIGSGTANSVLFIDGSGNLAQSPNLAFDTTAFDLGVEFNVSQTIEDLTGGTYLNITDLNLSNTATDSGGGRTAAARSSLNVLDNQAHTNLLIGQLGEVNNSSGAALNSVAGVASIISSTGGGVVTDGYGFRVLQVTATNPFNFYSDLAIASFVAGDFSFGNTQLAPSLTILNSGLIEGASTSLHNSSEPNTGASVNQVRSGGSFTPTITNGTNVQASTAFPCMWTRVGNVVTVGFRVDILFNVNNAPTDLQMTIPVPSNFSASTNAHGSGHSGDSFNIGAKMTADVANDTIRLDLDSGPSAASISIEGVYTYEVL